MIERLRVFLLSEAIAFALASMVHFGVLIHGYEHDQARIAEDIIANRTPELARDGGRS